MRIYNITAYMVLVYCLIDVARARPLSAICSALCGLLVALAWSRVNDSHRRKSK